MTLTIAIIAYVAGVLSVIVAGWFGGAVDAHERASRPVGRRRVR